MQIYESEREFDEEYFRISVAQGKEAMKKLTEQELYELNKFVLALIDLQASIEARGDWDSNTHSTKYVKLRAETMAEYGKVLVIPDDKSSSPVHPS